MQIIPLKAVPNQTLTALLANQNCRISVYQKFFGLYVDLAIGAVPILNGVIAQQANRIVRYAYLGFIGDLVFFDTQGSNDPDFTGLGSRYQFVYLEAADLLVTS
jgi:hypothetical protein